MHASLSHFFAGLNPTSSTPPGTPPTKADAAAAVPTASVSAVLTGLLMMALTPFVPTAYVPFAAAAVAGVVSLAKKLALMWASGQTPDPSVFTARAPVQSAPVSHPATFTDTAAPPSTHIG